MHAPLARLLAPAVLLAASILPAHGDQEPLRVLRALPDADASPNAQIRVTFDRPVAGSLDYSVDPKTVLRISPAATGRLEWRDPVTVVFTPTVPLRPATTYAVTVDTTFRAMDGAKLERPYTFGFRVWGARLLAATPVDSANYDSHVAPDQRFELVWSTTVDPARVAAVSYIQLEPTCAASERTVHLRPLGIHPVGEKENWRIREAGGQGRDRAADSLRRVISLAPQTPLPLDCAGSLFVPREMDSTLSQGLVRAVLRTYGPLTFSAHACPANASCPTGPISLGFSNDVRGSAVRRLVKLIPDVPFTMADTARESTVWQLDAELKPRTRYAIVVDTGLRDVYGQKLTGNPAAGYETTGYEPGVSYTSGRLLVESKGFGTLAVRHVNVDTLLVTTATVPDSLEGDFLRSSNWRWSPLWKKIAAGATVTRIPVRHAPDTPLITGVRIPVPAAGAKRGLVAVRIGYPNEHPRTGSDESSAIALVQVTDIALHAKLAPASGVVWVTRVSDGAAVAGATVRVHDVNGRVLAVGQSDARGLAAFPRLVRAPARAVATDGDEEDEGGYGSGGDGYVEALTADDRALVGVSEYDPDLSPWQFGVSGAWGTTRLPVAAAVFTERGIYRPGEPIYVKAILRRGPLGALAEPVARDSVRWMFYDREGATIRDTVVRLNSFGTAAYATSVPADAKLGSYTVGLQYQWGGKWQELGHAYYRVAEYRPPEFLVDVATPKGVLFAGDSLRATIEARYLFGAPMARAAVEWRAMRAPIGWWGLEIPGLERGDWYLGDSGWWWDDENADDDGAVVTSATDTLDATGHRVVKVAIPTPSKGRAATLSLTATVTDVNRQSVAGWASVIVHPADFYVAVKPLGDSWFWRAGGPQSVAVFAVRPSGEHVRGVAVRGSVVRREWHQVHRERDGAAETVGEWVSDTVAHCALTTAEDPVRCDFTPAEGGTYVVSFDARDAKGRAVHTSFVRWATGGDWVPWEDESRFRMDLIADKSRYSVGDTATVMVASPFTNAEAWITVEREGLIEQRRMTLQSGSQLLKFPITEAYAPNAFVSVVVTRGRSAPPGRLDDPGRPTIRVGYVELRVTPETKRLAVTVQPLATEYRPADSARVRLHVADARGVGRRAEVTLWAVDEGVLALTGYKTPDPLDLLYQPRGLGMRLASNLISV
ncbi:MAG: hypothetical protein HOQ19_12675, partial [Gemmatimonadaceae bacterium]|nr:hypothetical protein [Gemmatimonadaceae bacterium]